MKRNSLLLILVLLASPGIAQAPKTAANPQAKTKPASPFTDYAGDWTANLDGKVWLRLRLTLQNDRLIGAMVHARNLSTDDSGGLKSVSEEESSETLMDAVLNPDGLVLTFKDVDSQETDRYLMRLLQPSKQTAELKIIGQAMPPGMAKPKPWKLEKSADANPPPQ